VLECDDRGGVPAQRESSPARVGAAAPAAHSNPPHTAAWSLRIDRSSRAEMRAPGRARPCLGSPVADDIETISKLRSGGPASRDTVSTFHLASTTTGSSSWRSRIRLRQRPSCAHVRETRGERTLWGRWWRERPKRDFGGRVDPGFESALVCEFYSCVPKSSSGRSRSSQATPASAGCVLSRRRGGPLSKPVEPAPLTTGSA
jgi:hypothetical protein